MNRHRRIAVLAGTVGIAGLLLAAVVLPVIADQLSPHAATSGPLGGAPGSARSDGGPPSAARPGTPEFSPSTEASLWPVPTFKDDCGPQAKPSADPPAGSGDQGCDMAPSASPPRDGHRSHEVHFAVLAILVALAMAIMAALLTWRRRAAKARRAEQIRRWRRACVILDDIASEIMAFELDPHARYTRPLLADVSEPATAEFYKAYTAAHSLRTPVTPPDEGAITAFAAAAADARRAFDAADLNARTKAGSVSAR